MRWGRKQPDPTPEQLKAVRGMVASSWQAINAIDRPHFPKTQRFKTNQAQIRRYFAWCFRHSLDPADEKHFRVYFGTRHDTSYYKDTPYQFAPAVVESVWGKGRCLSGPAKEGEKPEDFWRVVLIATKRKIKEDEPLDRRKIVFTASCDYEFSSGAVFPFNWKIQIPLSSWAIKGRAHIVFLPRNNFISFEEVYESILVLKHSDCKWPRYDYQAQPYAYRSRRSRQNMEAIELRKNYRKRGYSCREAKYYAQCEARDPFRSRY